ncbi:aminopeptidase [Streptomyces sp. NBC_01462]
MADEGAGRLGECALTAPYGAVRAPAGRRPDGQTL